MKKKVNKEELTKEQLAEIKDKLPKYLLNCIPDPEMIKTGIITGSILDENVNPMCLSSSSDFSKHGICLDNELNILTKEEFIPYLVTSLSQMYYNNILKFYKGDVKKAEKHYDDAFKDQQIEYIDINDPSVCSDMDKEITSTKKNIEHKSKELATEVLLNKKNVEITEGEKDMVSEALDKSSEMAQEMSKGLSKKDREDKEKEILENLKKVEQLLTGKVEEVHPKIDLESLKKTLEKHGPRAVKEELMRLEPAERDALLTQLTQTKLL